MLHIGTLHGTLLYQKKQKFGNKEPFPCQHVRFYAPARRPFRLALTRPNVSWTQTAPLKIAVYYLFRHLFGLPLQKDLKKKKKKKKKKKSHFVMVTVFVAVRQHGWRPSLTSRQHGLWLYRARWGWLNRSGSPLRELGLGVGKIFRRNAFTGDDHLTLASLCSHAIPLHVAYWHPTRNLIVPKNPEIWK